MTQGLAGKVAIVTGAASGIGRATAILFAEQGADLVLVDRDGGGLRAVTDDIAAMPEGSGRVLLEVTLDLAERGDCARLSELAVLLSPRHR